MGVGRYVQTKYTTKVKEVGSNINYTDLYPFLWYNMYVGEINNG